MLIKRIILVLLTVFMVLCASTPSFAGISLSDPGIKIGAWIGVQPSASGISNFQTLQQRKLDTVMTYVDWNTEFNSIQSNIIDPIYNNGSIAIFTWEAHGLSTMDINNGVRDAYINRMATAMKSYGREIWIPLFHEGNGNWYSWGIGDSAVNTNNTYKAAYQRVVNIFRSQGATNVKWIFNINCTNNGANASYLGHYPGDSYVDYLAMDGYNWGTTQSWGSVWQTFEQIFQPAYSALATIEKPIILDEIASTEIGGNKATWITNTYNTIRTSYTRIKVVSWFGENKETDWRINSSQATLDAYRAAIAGTTPTPTPTLRPTQTPTPTITRAATPTPIQRVTPTPTRRVTPTPTRRGIATPTSTRRNTVTVTPTPTTRPATPTPTTRNGGYIVSYVIQSDWGVGATISVTIKNNSTTSVNGWTLAWTFPGNQIITNLWNGSYTQSGASVSVKDGGFNANIPANGASVNFGFNLNYIGTNAKPTSFSLNGTVCQVQ